MPKSKRDSDWNDGFLFVGNHVILDFLNTQPVQNGEPQELLPDFGAVLRWFHASGLISSHQRAALLEQWSDSVRARQTVGALRELREKLRVQITSWENGGPLHRATVAELNQLMADYPMLTTLTAQGSQAFTKLRFAAVSPEDLFAPLAHGAAALFAGIDPARVRNCGNCVLHFYDTSKKGTRRWCSMRLCGNRLKVAAYAARQLHS